MNHEIPTNQRFSFEWVAGSVAGRKGSKRLVVRVEIPTERIEYVVEVNRKVVRTTDSWQEATDIYNRPLLLVASETQNAGAYLCSGGPYHLPVCDGTCGPL